MILRLKLPLISSGLGKSPFLSEDIVLIGAENLVHPIPGIAVQSRR